MPEEIPTLVIVKSTNLVAIGYNPEMEFLYIRFKGKREGEQGPLWRYAGVPARVHAGLMAAFSKGKYFHAQIRGKYNSIKID